MSIAFVTFAILTLGNLSFAASIYYALRTRRVAPGGRFLMLLLSALIVWMFSRMMEDVVPMIDAKLFWARAQYFGIATVPVLWLMFALAYARRARWLRPPIVAALFVMPVLTIFMAWTNDAHRLLWARVAPVSTGSNLLLYTHGPFFYVALAYNYTAVVLGALVFLDAARNAKALQRPQARFMALSAVAPLLANIVYVLGLSPIKGFDLTPFGLSLSVWFWATSGLRDRFLDIVPARDAVLTHLTDGVIVLDEHDLVTDINPAARQMLGIPESVSDVSWSTVLTRHLRLQQQDADDLCGPRGFRREAALRDGAAHDDLTVELIGSVVYERARIVGRIIVLRDISDRIAAERATRQMNAQLERAVDTRTSELKQISHQLSQTQEEERARIGRELHDQVGANLSSLGMLLGLVKSALAKNDRDELAGRVIQAESTLIDTTQVVRNLMADLRPPVLDDYGLLASLRWLAEQWESVATMQIAVDGSAPEPTLSREVQIALFRITQEALNNAARHAQAKRVTVRLEHDAGTVCGVLTITDDGRGFDPRAGRRAGWGLDNMRARANAIDGAFQIDSQAGCGTTVRVVVPLHAATATELSGAPEHAGAAIEVQHG